jgi:hypothetical protein
MLPVIEALLAGVAAGIINRFLARLELECPDAASTAMRRDDSSTSTASSGTVEIPHFN